MKHESIEDVNCKIVITLLLQGITKNSRPFTCNSSALLFYALDSLLTGSRIKGKFNPSFHLAMTRIMTKFLYWQRSNA